MRDKRYLASRISHLASRISLIERAPEIPGRDRSIRPPFLADLLKLFRGRQFFAAESFRETFLHTVIGDRPDIEPSEIKEEQHLYCPPADASHGGEPLDDFLIAHAQKSAPCRHRAVERFCGQIFQRRDLAARKSASAQFFIRRREDQFGIEKFPAGIECTNAAKNRRSGFAAELLVSNRFGQGIEWPNDWLGNDVEGQGLRDERGEAWIAAGEMIDGVLHERRSK